MQYYVDDLEVSFLQFRESLKESMEHLYGDMWIAATTHSQIDYIIENMTHNHNQVNVNHKTYLIE